MSRDAQERDGFERCESRANLLEKRCWNDDDLVVKPPVKRDIYPPVLDYQAPNARVGVAVQPAVWAFLGIVAVVNLVIVGIAAADRSWLAMGMALYIGPATNLVVLLALLVAALAMEIDYARSQRLILVAIALGAPIAAVVIDFCVIFSLGLRGC